MKKLIVLWLVFAASLAYSKNHKEALICIPFQLTDEGHIVMEASVNGIKGVFIFDTGAGLNVLTKKFADKVTSLEKTDGFYTGYRATGEALQADLWKTKAVEMGAFRSTDQTFAIIEADLPIDGIISLLPFRQIPFTIDYANHMIRIESKRTLQKIKKSGRSIPIQIEDNRDKALDIFTYITLNNTLKLQVALDGGAGFDVYRFNARYMEALGIDATQVTKTYKTWDFNPLQGNNYYDGKLSHLSAFNDSVEVNDFKAQFIEGLIYEGIISMNWLGNEITIDIEKKELIIK